MNLATELPLTVGSVVEADSYAVTVLVGDQEEEWTFPRALVPAAVRAGDTVRIRFEAGRPVVIGGDTHDETVEARLTRPLNRRRLQLLAS